MLTDRAVVEALREAAARGVKVRIWRDASEAARLSEFDVEAQLGGPVPRQVRSSAPGGELMHLKGYCVDHGLPRGEYKGKYHEAQRVLGSSGSKVVGRGGQISQQLRDRRAGCPTPPDAP